MEEKMDIEMEHASQLSVEERLELLEERLQEVEEENNKLRKAIVSLEQFRSDMKHQVESVNRQFEEMGDKLEIIENRVDGAVTSIEDIEDEQQEQREDIEYKYADISQRLTRIEDMLDFDVIEATLSDENRDQTVIEQFSALPADVKQEKLDTQMRRATILYENFSSWGSQAQIGSVITSGEIKKFLSTACDCDLQWAQIYRVMEAFDEGTPPEYEYKETEKHGKILVKHKDTSSVRADKALE